MNAQIDLFCPGCRARLQPLPAGRHPVIATPMGRVLVELHNGTKEPPWLDLSVDQARALVRALGEAIAEAEGNKYVPGRGLEKMVNGEMPPIQEPARRKRQKAPTIAEAEECKER